MSLDTILRIGRVLKNGSEKPMKHFRYVSQPSFSDDVVFLSIPLKEDYIFDWGNICVVPEKDREQMFFFGTRLLIRIVVLQNMFLEIFPML